MATADLAERETWVWPADVLAFARKEGVEPYLEPVRQAIVRLFPAGRDLKVAYEPDPELRDVAWVAFEVTVPEADLPDYHAARAAWYRELDGVCPKPLAHLIDLSIVPEPP